MPTVRCRDTSTTTWSSPTGAEPIRAPLPGIDADGIHGLRPEVLEKAQQVVGEKYGNYSGVLKIDGDVGNKKLYDPRRLTPRSWPRGSVCTRLVTDSLHRTRRRAYLPDVLHS